MHLSDDAPQPPGNTDLASLSFPHLRELRLTNNVVDRLVFDEAHYPQLRRLLVERTADTGCMVYELQLQLPHLLTFELEGVYLPSLNALSACLSTAACPRLRRFSAVSVDYHSEGDAPSEMNVDGPWLERFEIQQMELTMLTLRAPRLTELHLINCSELELGVLLPDGEPPAEDAAADVADAAVAVPDSTCEEDVQTTIRLRDAMAILGLHANGPSPQAAVRVACSKQRIDLTVCNLGYWRATQNFADLADDPRIRGFDDQDYDLGDEGGSQVSEGDEPWQYMHQYGEPNNYVFGGDDYDEADDYGDA